MQRYVDLACSPTLAEALGRAVAAYAYAAFPPGGSECAQVSRAALLDTARGCMEHGGGALRVRRRQLAQLRAAVRWYRDESDGVDETTVDQLAALLEHG